MIEVNLQLESFREYIKLTESTIEIELKQRIEHYNKFLREGNEEEIREFYNYEDHEIREQTHQLFFNSLFISIYSFLEKKMLQLCKLAESKQLIKVRDLSDDGIVKYRKYLTKILCINLDEVNIQWDLFMRYKVLRNLLVHTSTNTIDFEKSNLQKIVTLRSIDGLIVEDREGFVEFEIRNKQLLLDFCSAIGIFLKHVHYEKH
ncbi:MAG: hypothetical protein ABL895_12665 [Cyclobacteriaceae bacterium]